jgi:tRNA A58 N-methylase Trm61
MAESSFLNPLKVVKFSGMHEGMRVADFGSGSGFLPVLRHTL